MRTLIISILLLTFFTTELISTNIPSKSYFQNNPKKKKKKHKKKKTLAHRQINNPDIQKSELESMSESIDSLKKYMKLPISPISDKSTNKSRNK